MRAGVAGVLLGDDEVEVAGGDVEERELGFALGDLDAQVGVLDAQQRERLRHHGVRGRLERRDAHGAADGGERARDLGLGLFEAVEHGAGVGDEQFGLRRELHATSGLHEQRHAGLAFELAELLRDRRGAVREGLGDGRERAALAQFDEQAKASHIEHVGLRDIRSFIRFL